MKINNDADLRIKKAQEQYKVSYEQNIEEQNNSDVSIFEEESSSSTEINTQIDEYEEEGAIQQGSSLNISEQGAVLEDLDENSATDVFNQLDLDGNGEISESEIESATSSLNATASQIKNFLSNFGFAISSNEKNSSKASSTTNVSNPFDGIDDNSASELFNQFDLDGNGKINESELNSASNSFNATVSQVKDFLANFGFATSNDEEANNDSKENSTQTKTSSNSVNVEDLTDADLNDFQEVAKKSKSFWQTVDKLGLENIFEKLDTNGDGKLDESELQAAANLDKNGDSISVKDLKKLFKDNNIETDDTSTKKSDKTEKAESSNKTQSSSPTASSGASGASGASGNSGVARASGASGGSSGASSVSKPQGLDAMSLEELESEKATRESKLNEKQQAVNDVNSGQNAAVQSAKNEETQAKQKYEEALKNDDKVSKELKEKEAKNMEALDKNQSEIDNKKADISAKEGEIFDSETKKSCLESELSSLESSLTSLPAKSGKEEDKEKDAEIDEKRASIEQQITSKKSEITAEEEKLQTAKDKLEEMKTQLEELETKKSELEKEKSEIEEEILKTCAPETKEALNAYNQARTNVETVKQSELQKAQSELQTAQSDVQEISQKITEKKNEQTAKENSVSGDMQGAVDFAKQFAGMSQADMQKIFAEKGYQFDAGAWCADFVRMAIGEGVGLDNVQDWYKNSSNPAYCPTVNAEGAGSKVSVDEAQPGDAVLFDWDGDGNADHIGLFMDQIDSTTIHTIEGNTSGSGGSSCVSEKDRNMGNVLSIISMAK